jgi:hypothetical protein
MKRSDGMTHYLHSVPGRVRIRNPILKAKNTHNSVKEILSTLMGIQNIVFNNKTGSITIFYDYSLIDTEHILNALEISGYFDPARVITNDQHIHTMVTNVGRYIRKTLFGTAMGIILEGSPYAYIALLI